MMDNIAYSITSRGELKIEFEGEIHKITGELVFNPPKFYADRSSLNKITTLDNDQKKQLVEFIERDSLKRIGTEIVFD